MGSLFSSCFQSTTPSLPTSLPSDHSDAAAPQHDHTKSSVLEFHSKKTWDAEWPTFKTTNKMVVIDFSASWCGPCHFIEPIFKTLAERFSDRDRVIFAKIDVDELKDVAREWKVEAMPTFVFVKEGKEVDRLVGADKDDLEHKIQRFFTTTS